MTTEVPERWKGVVGGPAAERALAKVDAFLARERAAAKVIYPAEDRLFAALALTPPEAVKVVILGQDPYHGPGQAHGLSFSVPEGEPLPPSLRNIYKELREDLGVEPRRSGNLSDWARQGVLLLNAVLTVEASAAGSHAGQGWEEFTDALIARLSERTDGVAFVLWGAYAQKKAALIDASRHFVLKSAHPSPLSAHRGFFGSRPFSKINEYLISKGKTPISW